MSDIFENEDSVSIEMADDFDEADIDVDVASASAHGLDARRRLENMLDEKRLRDELEDFVDFE